MNKTVKEESQVESRNGDGNGVSEGEVSRVQEVGINNESQRDAGKKQTESLTWLECATKEAIAKQLMNEKIMATKTSQCIMRHISRETCAKVKQNLSDTKTKSLLYIDR